MFSSTSNNSSERNKNIDQGSEGKDPVEKLNIMEDNPVYEEDSVSPTVYRDLLPAYAFSSAARSGTLSGDDSFNLPMYQPQVFRSVGEMPDNGGSFRTAFRDAYERDDDEFSINDIGFDRAQSEPVEDPPEAPGGYLEKTVLHCSSSMKPIELMKGVELYLKEQRIDYSSNRNDYKIKCNHYHGCASLEFNVRIFSHQKKYAIEVQRRMGCFVEFSKMFQEMGEEFFKSGLCDGSGNSSGLNRKAKPFCAPPLDLDDLDDLDDLEDTRDGVCPLGTNVKGCVKNIMEMMDSDYTDVKSNALKAIGNMTSHEDACGKDILGKQLHKFMEMLSSEDVQIQRGSATCLANLTAKRAGCCKQICNGNGVEKLLELTSSTNLQVARECCRALSNIGAMMGPKILTNPFKEKLQKLMMSSDTRLRENADLLLQTVAELTG